jgi:hypothetical protein
MAVGLVGCAAGPADSAELDARPRDAPSDAGATDATQGQDAQREDTTPADSSVEDAQIGETITEDATGADAEAAAAECTPGETRACLDVIAPCGMSAACRNDGTWEPCYCVSCDSRLAAGTCSWTVQMSDDPVLPDTRNMYVVRVQQGVRSALEPISGSLCAADGGWYSELSGDGGPTILTVTLCPASCAERESMLGVDFVLGFYCVSWDP